MNNELTKDELLANLAKRKLSRSKVKKAIMVFTLSFILLGFILASWAFWFEPDSLVVRKVEIKLENWHKEHDGLKIAILTDLHVGSPHINLEKLSLLVAETNKENADLALILGDLVATKVKGGKFIEPEPIAEKLKGLKAEKIVAVLGNHDWWYNGERVIKALQDVGIIVLENNSITFSKNEKNIWLAGLADLWTRKIDLNKALEETKDNNPILLLTHNPDIFPEIPEQVSLTLAGHTHGGQVKLSFLGRPVVPSKYGERYAIGHVKENNRNLFVGSGVGTSIIPVRFCVPPEVTILTIKKE
ncbi:MAG: metallophosphoesterase [Blastocatellia bacterium]